MMMELMLIGKEVGATQASDDQFAVDVEPALTCSNRKGPRRTCRSGFVRGHFRENSTSLSLHTQCWNCWRTEVGTDHGSPENDVR